MKFFDAITKNTIRDEINRICGTTDEVYALRDKLARVNQALDTYWHLASNSAPKGTFDDVNQSAIPVETQSLVDGTNNYKISSFSNEVLQILKLSILEDDGTTERDLVREEFDDYNDFLHWYSTTAADEGTPQWWTKMGDFIYLRPNPSYNETNGLRAYVNRELSKLEYVTYVAENTGNTLDLTAHGLSDGDTVILSTAGVMPNGWTADTQVYYVVNKNTDDFQVALTEGGSAVTISSDGTGTQKYVHISKTPGIPVIHHDYLARKAALPFLIEKKLPQMGATAQLVAINEQSIQDYWNHRGRELSTIITPRKRPYR